MLASSGKIYVLEDVEIDIGRVLIRRAGEERGLRPKTFRLLIYLVENRDRLVPKEELIEQLWTDTAVSDGALAQCVADIRRALGDDPRSPRYIRTAPRLGYQFIGCLKEAPVQSVTIEETTEERIDYSEEIIEEEPAAARPAGLLSAVANRGRRRLPLWLALTTLVLTAGVGVWKLWVRPAPRIADPGIRTAIFQFENRSGNSEMDWLRLGLADMLATSLSTSPKIALITPEQLQRGLPSTSSARLPDALRAARQAGARALVLGGFGMLRDSVRLDAQIYDVASGRLMGGESLTVENPALLLAKLDPFAAKLAARLGAPLAAEVHLGEVMTNNLEAYRLYSLGVARTRALRLPEAIELYQKALELDPAFAMAYARIGYTYSSSWATPAKGRPYLEKAYRLSDRLTQRDRMFIRAWYSIACQDYEGAERAYREMLPVFPLEVEAYLSLANLLNGEHRSEEARQTLKRGLAIDPEMPDLYNALSGAYLDLKQGDQAIESARRYVALSSGEPNAYDSLGAALQATGQYGEAREAFLQAVRKKPDFNIAVIHLGNLAFQMGRYDEAVARYREFSQLGSNDQERSRGHAYSFWVYWRKKDFKRAQAEAAERAREDQSFALEPLLLAADQGKLGLTDELLRQILGVSPVTLRGGPENRRTRYFVAGYVALREHKTDEALTHFRAALLTPHMFWAPDPLETCLADAWLELGRLDEAIGEYRRVLSFNPNYAMARYRLGLALERKGMHREARSEFERFLTIWKDADPDVPELLDARQRL
ncbi:MAG TPA: tetratricopeptide repeat protein [Bryobacteraceae bacterium]|nr:tetratricopeptide repeat protein [Bryobacteraceae bacterium]